MDGLLVVISLIDLFMTFLYDGSPKLLGVLRVLRLLRSLRPLRVINRAPGLKLVVETLISSIKPIGNIVVIAFVFFVIFGILGVQLFKGMFYYCAGPELNGVRNKEECEMAHKENHWKNQKYNFDNLGQALMALFVLSSKDGWMSIMVGGVCVAVWFGDKILVFSTTVLTRLEKTCSLFKTIPSGELFTSSVSCYWSASSC